MSSNTGNVQAQILNNICMTMTTQTTYADQTEITDYHESQSSEQFWRWQSM